MPDHHVILYTRHGCHLCEVARRQLQAAGLAPVLRDIDEDDELLERYDTIIPVVVIDGRERFRGRVNPVLLQRLLSQ